MISSFTYKLLVAGKLPGVGRKTLRDLSSDRMFFELELEELAENFPELKALRKGTAAWSDAKGAADRDVELAEKNGHFILSALDSKYPKLLANVADRPEIIFVRGDPARFTHRSVAVVGTREPTRHGIVTAARITAHFVADQWQIVSGLALGIDTIAHQCTLENKGSTVAVLAHGLDTVYPKENKLLAEQIVEAGGILLSEYAYNSRTFPSNFVERDRIQAALATCVVMVQSDEQGGSWHASRAALRYGRFLVVPRPTDEDQAAREPKIRGNLKIIQSSTTESSKFLKCRPEDINRVVVLEGRNDYELLACQLASVLPLGVKPSVLEQTA
ncbi:DNA-processing protein DprA [Duganella sp. HH101]|uniref:DNA-processing protein DprA n=1 Tax=Duganella sp. HH101 TaxID=1781066 RepID=UPI00087538B9|nr:DNA-processing protein DprA [Duganella sp. HH101]OFA00171.1 hypothetical protein DUGA2_50040 [Duganella sp. HH101]